MRIRTGALALLAVAAVAVGCGDDPKTTINGSKVYDKVPQWTCQTVDTLTACRLDTVYFAKDPSKGDVIPPCRPVTSVIAYPGGRKGWATSIYAWCQKSN